MTTDAQLLGRSGREPSAFGVLFDRHSVAVHGFLARRGGAQLADDLLVEVFARAFAARDRFDPAHDDARPWLYGIARYTLLAELRGRSRQEAAASRQPPAAITDPYRDADDRLDAQSRRAEMAGALTRLPEPEREVLLLVAWEGLSPAEAARVLGVPAGTARSRLHRARAQLRTLLQHPSFVHAVEES